jgi:predicted CDP-diglyceride synthetase/phosphatidate cytidylyltransferase
VPEKDPSNYPLITYLWVIVLASIGGAVNFARKLKAGTARAFNITEFVGELMTSGFAGVLTFWLCEATDINKLISAVLIGISGHMGSRAIFKIEKWAEEKFGSAK